MAKRNYWVVSPNVKNNEEENDWKNFLSLNPYSFIGWGPDNNMGKTFIEKIKKGDVIINAQRKNWIPYIYGIGVVKNDKCNWQEIEGTTSGAYCRELHPYIIKLNADKLNLDFYGTAYYGDNPTIPSIYQLHPGKNQKDKELIIKIETELKKMETEEYIKNYVALLENNKNIILTGAPGTGKTYLAIKIAEELIKSTSMYKDANSFLIDKINSFIKNDELREKRSSTIKSFQEKFSVEILKNITLEQYCTGRTIEYPDNFCNWIENGLTKHSLGGFAPGTAKSFRIYWDKKEEKYIKTGFVENETDENAIKMVREKLASFVENKDFGEFTKYFGVSFAIKILSSYYPDAVFPINGANHIENVLKLFKINCTGNLLEKNKAIFDWYKEQTKGKDITPVEFMNILYNNFNIKQVEITSTENIIYTKGEYDFVQFHPSYDYTDFVEGLRPKKELGDNEIGFELKNGVFKDFCKRAKDNPNKKYVFIIDEINRGEISKIFGELFFSIDPSYRGIIGKVKTQYANIQTEESIFSNDLDAGDFFVPENVYIIGTMNDIDRSVESFDFAMRRRFCWLEITAEESKKMFNNEVWKNEAEIAMCNINNAISEIEGLGLSYHIGGAYFKTNIPKYIDDKGKTTSDTWAKLWSYNLKPLLFEYLRGMPNAKDLIIKFEYIYSMSKKLGLDEINEILNK